MGPLLAGDPGPVRCGPLALAASAYWWAARRASITARAGFLRTATEQVEILADIATSGHPAIQARAERRAHNLITLIQTRFPETDA